MSTSVERAKRGLRSEWQLHALSIVSLMVAFLCLGASLLALTNIHALRDRWSQTGRISVYLRDTASSTQIEPILTALRSSSEIRNVRYLSPLDARSQILNNNTDPVLAALPQDAFPASIELDVASTLSSAEMQTLIARLQRLPAVENVETYSAWAERLNGLFQNSTVGASALAILVLGAVLAVLTSTMRLVLSRRRLEVEVLRLVGATDEFVRQPYMLEGMFQGAVASFGSLLILGLLFMFVRTKFDGELSTLLGLHLTFLPWYLMVGFVTIGTLWGALGAILSLRKLTTV